MFPKWKKRIIIWAAPNTKVEYKLIIRRTGGTHEWERCEVNRILHLRGNRPIPVEVEFSELELDAGQSAQPPSQTSSASDQQIAAQHGHSIPECGIKINIPRHDPNCGAMSFRDPRRPNVCAVPLLGFYFPGKNEVWDEMCASGFLGNFYDLGRGCLVLPAPPSFGGEGPRQFRNAEAAYQALKFWSRAHEFEGLSGEAAWQKSRRCGAADMTFGGHGSNWAAMKQVLLAKFHPGTPLSDHLLKTGDSFLLEHASQPGRDDTWSDDCSGRGRNWLGIQLMLLRDDLSGRPLTDDGTWTKYLSSLIDPSSGNFRGREREMEWKLVVQDATANLVLAVANRGR